jgi:hypothetical protein
MTTVTASMTAGLGRLALSREGVMSALRKWSAAAATQ